MNRATESRLKDWLLFAAGILHTLAGAALMPRWGGRAQALAGALLALYAWGQVSRADVGSADPSASTPSDSGPYRNCTGAVPPPENRRRKPETELVERWPDGKEPGWLSAWMILSFALLIAGAIFAAIFILRSFLLWRFPTWFDESVLFGFARYIIVCVVSLLVCARVAHRSVEKKSC